jgi:hypothetical protein
MCIAVGEFQTVSFPCLDTDGHYSLLFEGKLPPNVVDHQHSEKLRDAYSKFRGIPRICFYALRKDAMRAHLENVKGAISQIQSIEKFMLFLDGASSKLVRIEPVEGTNWRGTHTSILSDYIFQRFADRTTFTVIENLLSSPLTRRNGGKLFEQVVHRKFCAGFKFSPRKLTYKAPNLTVDIIKFDNEADGYFHSLSVQATTGANTVHSKYLKRYLVAVSKPEESVDSVWLGKNYTVFFQMTVNPNHGLDGHEVMQLVNELPADARKDVRIVFVVPHHDEQTKKFERQKITFPMGTSQTQQDEVNGYPQYVYYFDLNRLQFQLWL